MNTIQRICTQCGHGNPVEARYCAHCGHDSQAALPAPRRALPAVIGQAALPVLVGVAGWAVRVGWKLLQARLQQPARVGSAPPALNLPARPLNMETLPASRGKRTIHIRSAWAVNQGDGVWRQGVSEQTIELED